MEHVIRHMRMEQGILHVSGYKQVISHVRTEHVILHMRMEQTRLKGLQLAHENGLQLLRIRSEATNAVRKEVGSHSVLYTSQPFLNTTVQHPTEGALVKLKVLHIARTVLHGHRLIRQLRITAHHLSHSIRAILQLLEEVGGNG